MRRKIPFLRKAVFRCIGGYFMLLVLVSIAESTFSQTMTKVSGKVSAQDNGMPLPGVRIETNNNSARTVTDIEGNYSLSVAKGTTLVYSFIGFDTEERVAGSESVLNVVMSANVRSMDEVVVTGYSTQRKKDITGSVSVLNMDELKASPSFSAEQALQGLASGVNVIRSGVPGASSKIMIRGVTNFGNTQPLVIVDGIQQDLNNISADDIESIQVLKDAGSAAIYGVRGANGVILVTTKKGKKGIPVIKYNASYGTQFARAGNPYNLMNPEEYMQVYNKAYPGNPIYSNGIPDYSYMSPGGSGVASEGDPEIDPSRYYLEAPNKGKNYVIYKLNKAGTNWFQELYKQAPAAEHNISASGGTEKSSYLFSVNYLNQQGTLVESYLKRYSARINTEFKLGNVIRIGENINLIGKDVGGVYGSTAPYTLQSIIPVRDIMGNWAGSFGGPALGQAGNPIAAQARHRDDIDNQWLMIGNVYAEADILKDFTARTSLGYNLNNYYEQHFSPTPYETSESNNALNRLSIDSGYERTMTFTNSLVYKKTFDRHHVEALFGSEFIEYNRRGQSGTKQNFFAEDPDFLVLSNGEAGIDNGSAISKNTLFSVFSRLDYAFADKYLIALTARRDGSSRFGSGKKYGLFPSVSLGWRLSEEKFMKSFTWLDDLKLRASYGILGSQNNVDPQNQYDLYYSATDAGIDHYYDIAGTNNSAMQGFGIQRFGNTNTGWEENIISNAGFDARLLNGKVDLSLEYYKKSVQGLLFSEPLPAVLGNATAPQINIGNIKNSGVDFTARYNGKINGDLTYSVGGNITTYKNRIEDIPGPGYFDAGEVRNAEGHPVSSFFGYKVIGLFNSQAEVTAAPTQNGAAPGRFQYADIDGDGTISPADRTHLGDPNPDFTYGTNLGLQFKNFDFSAFFYGSQGNAIYSSIRKGLDFMGYFPTWNKSRALLNAWTPENTGTTIPKIESSQSFSTSLVNNSYYIEDGSFLKLRSLMVGYSAHPKKMMSISQIRIYAQASNLFTFTKYSGIDPEVGGSSAAFGIDGGRYPTDETSLFLGLSVTF